MKFQVNRFPDMDNKHCMQIVLSKGEFINQDSRNITFTYDNESLADMLEASLNSLMHKRNC